MAERAEQRRHYPGEENVPLSVASERAVQATESAPSLRDEFEPYDRGSADAIDKPFTSTRRRYFGSDSASRRHSRGLERRRRRQQGDRRRRVGCGATPAYDPTNASTTVGRWSGFGGHPAAVTHATRNSSIVAADPELSSEAVVALEPRRGRRKRGYDTVAPNRGRVTRRRAVRSRRS